MEELIMEMSNSLSLEQKFKLQVLNQEVKQLSREQAQDYLMEVLRQNMVKDNLFKNLMNGQAWRSSSLVLISALPLPRFRRGVFFWGC